MQRKLIESGWNCKKYVPPRPDVLTNKFSFEEEKEIGAQNKKKYRVYQKFKLNIG